ncbi:MAG: 3-dehydroquinate synthase [Planctomycetota bacterium]|nr:3-dehydroquinate synthase [Planctomycetota bacterium]
MTTPQSTPGASQIVPVELGARSYQIRIQAGLLPLLGQDLAARFKFSRVLVVSDQHIGPLHGGTLATSLHRAGVPGEIFLLPPGEGAKSWEVCGSLYGVCFQQGLDRGSALIALGGGVIGDLTGFVAATYMRGIDFVQVPTTLLAMVDASVGGKTAIDHPQSKNGIGAFHQPRAVYIDTDALGTLPARELRAGLAEVLKYGVLEDAAFFEWLEANLAKLLARDGAALAYAIRRSCEIKAAIVGQDERESEGGRRALLNYGHTFAHALESCTNYQSYLHGEAVAVGMVLAGQLAARRGLWSKAEAERVEALISKAGLPVKLRKDDPPPEDLHAATFRDKKTRGGKLRFVLATRLGATEVFKDVPADEALKVWQDAPRG